MTFQTDPRLVKDTCSWLKKKLDHWPQLRIVLHTRLCIEFWMKKSSDSSAHEGYCTTAREAQLGIITSTSDAIRTSSSNKVMTLWHHHYVIHEFRYLGLISISYLKIKWKIKKSKKGWPLWRPKLRCIDSRTIFRSSFSSFLYDLS